MGDEPVEGSVDAIAALRGAGKRVAFATNNCWHPGEDHVAKLWGFGVQASLADVVTVGGAHAAPAGRDPHGQHRLRDRHARAAPPRGGRGAEGAQRHRPRVARRRGGGRRHRRRALLAPARRGARGAPRRRPAGDRSRPHAADARWALARHGRAAGGRRDRLRPRPPRSWASPRRGSSTPRSIASARAARWWSATASTPTSRPPPRRASTPRWCSAAAAPGRPARRTPRPVAVAASLHALVER